VGEVVGHVRFDPKRTAAIQKVDGPGS
jgi:hypothetical protein